LTDTELLMSIINSKGLKLGYVADSMGLSRYGLYKKIRNVNPFTAPEIEKLCEILEITKLKDKENIFFANKVDR
jgi:hypothetical protein